MCVGVWDVAGVTILLSQTVFSLLVANVLTRTSEAVPLIGTFLHAFSPIFNNFPPSPSTRLRSSIIAPNAIDQEIEVRNSDIIRFIFIAHKSHLREGNNDCTVKIYRQWRLWMINKRAQRSFVHIRRIRSIAQVFQPTNWAFAATWINEQNLCNKRDNRLARTSHRVTRSYVVDHFYFI